MYSERQLVETSKFLSFVLRHRPEAVGLTLDSEGWADINLLVNATLRNGRKLDRDLIVAVVAGNDKKRFSLSQDGLHMPVLLRSGCRSARAVERLMARCI